MFWRPLLFSALPFGQHSSDKLKSLERQFLRLIRDRAKVPWQRPNPHRRLLFFFAACAKQPGTDPVVDVVHRASRRRKKSCRCVWLVGSSHSDRLTMLSRTMRRWSSSVPRACVSTGSSRVPSLEKLHSLSLVDFVENPKPAALVFGGPRCLRNSWVHLDPFPKCRFALRT